MYIIFSVFTILTGELPLPSTNRTIPPQLFTSCGADASATLVGASLSRQETIGASDHPFNSFYKKCKRKVSKRKMLFTLFNFFRHHGALPNFHTSDCHHMGDSTHLPQKKQISSNSMIVGDRDKRI